MKKVISPVLLFVVLLSVVFLSCQKEIQKKGNNTSDDLSITDTTIFIDITLDGERILGIQQLQDNGEYAPWYTVWAGAQIDTNIYEDPFQGCSLQIEDLSQRFDFIKGNFFISQRDPITDTLTFYNSFANVNAFLAPGNYPYSQYGQDTIIYMTPVKQLTAGIVLQYLDKQGVTWRTLDQSADQTGSQFTIINSKSGGDTTRDVVYGDVVTASFNCKMYDGKGHVKTLTNGRFRLSLWL